MASRLFNQFTQSLEKGLVLLYGRVTFGSTGAPTLDAAASKGIKSIARNSAGNYTVTLGSSLGVDIYQKLLTVQVMLLNATSPAAPLCHVVSEQVNDTSSPSFVIQFTAVDGTTATDPGSGEEMRFSLALRNSDAP